MKKLSRTPCPTCKKKFTPKSEKNYYCCRKCFKKAYYHRVKAEELKNKKCPTFLCPSCDQTITLDFDPVKDSFRWLHFVCPGCNVLMISVSELISTGDLPSV